MSSARRFIGILLAVSLALAAGVADAQWKLPADYSRDNDAQNPKDMRGGKGRGMRLLYYESFEGPWTRTSTGWGTMSLDWSQKDEKGAEGSNAIAYWVVEPGGGRPIDSSTRTPWKPYDGKLNMLCYGKSTGAVQRLVTPTMDLSQPNISDPRLVFYYASPKNFQGFCRMRIQYRIGENDDWKDLPDAPELGMAYDWVPVSIPLPPALRKSGLQIGFLSMQNYGYGTSIDEVYVVNMQGAETGVKTFDLTPQSPIVARGAKNVPLMRMDVTLSSGGGKLKLEGLNGDGKTKNSIKVHTADGGGNRLTKDALSNFRVFVGRENKFSSAVEAATLNVTSGTDPAYELKNFNEIKNHNALIMQGGNTYSVWIVADVKDDTPYKTRIWVDVDEKTTKFVWYENDAAPNSLNGTKQSFFPAEGYSYPTPEVQRSVVYKSLFFDDFEAGLDKWNRSSSAAKQLWEVGNPGGPFPTGKTPFEEQVKSAYSGNKVLATGELVASDALRARYFGGMVSAYDKSACAWVEIKQKIEASQVKDVYLAMQKSFNTPSGMLLFVEGKYEGDTTWVEFARYNVSSSDWQGWQELLLRLPKADGRKFNLRLLAFYPGGDVSHTGFIIDDFRILGNEVQNDAGIMGLKVTESWDNGKGRKAAFKVRNYGKNTQKDVKYDVYVDGNLALGKQSLPGGDLAAGESRNVETGELAALKADVNRDNTHEIEVRLTLSTADEDMSNNIARVTTYSYPTIKVSDTKPYPETFGEPMHHWFGWESYREGFKSSWLFNSVYSISKCRDNSGKQAGPFGEGMLLGSYIWTTGDHTAFGFEQSVLTSPVFEISTQDAKNRKEFVMAYTTQGKDVEVQVEYRKKDGEWQRLEKSAQWEKGWYDGSGAVWKGSTNGYKIVKTQLPDDLQGVGGAVKVQFRVYFYNRSAERVPGIAVNGIEVRSVRSDIYVKSIEPKGGCGNPLGNDETLRVTIAVNAEPAIAYEARKNFPVSIKVERNGETYSVVKPVDLPRLEPGDSCTFNTEVQRPWAEKRNQNSEVTVTLLPQSGENGEADEDVSNNVLTQTIAAKVPAVFPLKGIVKEDGGYVLYAMLGSDLVLQTKPEQGSGYEGYTFSDFSISGGSAIAAINNGTTFKASGVGSIKLKYKVNGECDEELPIEIKEAQCDVTVEHVAPVGNPNCKDEGEALAFKVTIKDNKQPSVASDLKLVVTQGGREVYKGDAKLGEQTVEVTKARSGGGMLKFTAVANADMDGSNNTKVYAPEVLLYPKPLEVFLQDVSDPTYMRRVADGSEQNTYGDRQWQLYVPKVSVIPEIKWTHRGYTMGSEENGYKVKLGLANGEFEALAKLKIDTDSCPAKKVFSVKVKNEDVEVLGLGGETGAPGLCADAQGEYEVYVSLMNHSWVSYSPGTLMGFELSGPNGESKNTVKVQLTDEWQPKVLLLLPLGKLPKELKDLAAGGSAVSLKAKYLGVYDADTVELTLDANVENNEKETELRLSSAPNVQWDVPDLKMEGSESVVRKVFQDVPTVTGTLKVKGGDPAGMHYAWYSKSKRADAWTLQEGGVQGPGVYNITGIADDCYRVEVTNQAGCRSKLEMRYIQTDLGFTSGEVMETPTASCSLTDNDGNVRLIFKNTGSKPLTSEEKFRVEIKVEAKGLVTRTSAEMYFSPALEVNESRSELVKAVNFSDLIAEIQRDADADLNGKASLSFRGIKIILDEDWSVSGATDRRKKITGKVVEEWGAPRPKVELYTGVLGTELYQGNEKNSKAKQVGPQEGFKGQVDNSIDNTYGNLVGLVSKAPGEKAEWLWHYTYTKFNKWPDVKLDYAVEDSVVSIPQAKQTDWMEANKNQVGTTPEGDPKRPEGTYTVIVTGAHECESKVEFSVADKAYDLKLESVRPPDNACDFKGKSTKVTVIVRNVGTMPIDPEAEISLKLTREDVGVSTEAWAEAAYTKFKGTAEGANINVNTYSIGKLNNGKALGPNEAIPIDVPVTLYCEAQDGQVVRSLFDGVTFKYNAEVSFVGDSIHEANLLNNKSAKSVEVKDISSPVVTVFYLSHSGLGKKTFTGDHVLYQWDEKNLGKPEGITLDANVSNEDNKQNRNWYLRGAMQENGGTNTKIIGESAIVKGYGSAELVVSKDGCEGTGVFTIVGTGAALMIDKIEGIPDELCPDQVAGKRKVTVRIVNPTPTPIITEEDGCGQGTKQTAEVTLQLAGDALKGGEVKKTLGKAEFFGPAKALLKGEQDAKGVWHQGAKEADGVGMSAFDTCVVTFDDVELNETNLRPGDEKAIKVTLSGGCVDKGTDGSKDKKVKVNVSPDLSEVLERSPLEQYAPRGSAAVWPVSWSSQLKLQEEMEWGEKGANSIVVRATEESSGTNNKYTLRLSVAKPGTYVLKVRDKDKGCTSSKEVEVQMPGFLTLADGDAITVEPKELLTGSCKYDKDAQGLKVRVVNNGNEPLEVAGKRTLIRLTYSKKGEKTSQSTSLDYNFDAKAKELGVGEEMEIDVSVPFKGVNLSGAGVYDLNFVLETGSPNPVDGAPDSLRSVNQKKLTVKRYYQPTAKPDLVEQVKAWGGNAVEFNALPKNKGVLTLYGLAGDLTMVNGRPTSGEYDTLQMNGATWTWYVDGKAVQGPALDAYVQRFAAPQPDGFVKVMIQTKDGCSLTSDSVEMRRLKEFEFGEVSLGKMSNSKCADEISANGTEQEVSGSFKLVKADVPLVAGTEIDLTCVYTQGSPDNEKTKEVKAVLGKEYKAGDLIEFKIKLPFKVGTNSVEVREGQYVDPHSHKPWPIGRSTSREIFEVKAFPTLQGEIDTAQKAYEKPYSIKLPAVEPKDEVEYQWESKPYSKSPDFSVEKSGGYGVRIKRSNGCVLNRAVRVDFYFKYDLTLGEGGSVKVIDTVTRAEYEPGKQVIKDGAKVKIEPVANPGYRVLGVNVNGNRFNLESVYSVVGDFRVEVLFEKVDTPTPPEPNAVESELMREVVAVNPFTGVLRLYGAENVESYVVYNQLGNEVLRGVNVLSGSVLDIDAAQLHEGVYVVRLRDSLGGERVLRVVKVLR